MKTNIIYETLSILQEVFARIITLLYDNGHPGQRLSLVQYFETKFLYKRHILSD
ncbi:hypothetical protein LVD15_02960 [Fulvivirga maritima]|uniref:hypothetical protein n=1 Tax=Fulvivirga maritima TaxID=2904247 RepID=UPI001F3B5EBC|nr:hypothetical protein [Fulvivirga maritima]UII27408.1 hypothetical protein LVD15_02960 [Fulvivirga maritima]